MSQRKNHTFHRRRWILLAYWLGMFCLTHWPKIERFRATRWFSFPNSDKVCHFLLYAGWTLSFCWLLATGRQRLNRRTEWLLLLGGAAYAVLDETTQAMVGRNPSVADFLADVLGIVVATGVFRWWQNRCLSRKTA